ncbi:Ctf8-domain-containing protein [Mycena floridula]|nr:Ctf8-domain-containing protein [Mycena floridula]
MPISINFASSAPGTLKLPSSLAKISHDEIVLIELQGTLEVPDDGPKDGKLVGKLKIDDVLSKPTLMIGPHLLEGKVANLPKPLAILHRSTTQQPRITDEDDEDMEKELPPVRKIIFSKRPTPIVGRHNKLE